MNNVYKILLVVIGLKIIVGITYMKGIIESIGTNLESLKNNLDFDSLFKLTDLCLTLIISIVITIGLVLQVLQKNKSLNLWLRVSIIYYTAFYILASLPSLILMDSLSFVARMTSLEKLRFFVNTLAIISLIIVYTIYINQFFKDKNHKITDDVSDKRDIRFLNYILDFLMIAYISFRASKYPFFQNWDYPTVFILLSFFYYFSLETLFKQTMGKVITGTHVYSQKYNYIGAVFLRTLCRRIPFEPLSFFGFGRWHDTLSKTEIVKINIEQK